MNAAAIATRTPVASRPAPARIALLGIGNVGNAVLARLAAWEVTEFGNKLSLRYIANSRFGCQPVSFADALARVRSPEAALSHGANALRDVKLTLGERGTRIVIDATASEDVAEQHAYWLAQGIHVVTACKLGQGASLGRWIAQNTTGRRSAVPDSVAGSDGYSISQRKRKLVEQPFGWRKLVCGLRQVMLRGLEKVDQVLMLTMAAYNLTRMRTPGKLRLQTG